MDRPEEALLQDVLPGQLGPANEWSTGYYGTLSRKEVTRRTFAKLQTSEPVTVSDLMIAELAKADALLEAGRTPGPRKQHPHRAAQDEIRVKKWRYAALCLLTGFFGGQYYYQKRFTAGVLCTLFCCTGVPLALSVCELPGLLCAKADKTGYLVLQRGRPQA